MGATTSAAVADNTGLNKFDNISAANGGGGGQPPLTPRFDEYGRLTGFIDTEGNEHQLNGMSDDEIEDALAAWALRVLEGKENDADKKEFSKGDNKGYTNYSGTDYSAMKGNSKDGHGIDGMYEAYFEGKLDGTYLVDYRNTGDRYTDKYYAISEKVVLALMLKDGYQPGTDILFASCYGASNGTGRKLSKLAQADVVAATNPVEPEIDYGYTTSVDTRDPGDPIRSTWMRYSNQKKSLFGTKEEFNVTDLNTRFLTFEDYNK